MSRLTRRNEVTACHRHLGASRRGPADGHVRSREPLAARRPVVRQDAWRMGSAVAETRRQDRPTHWVHPRYRRGEEESVRRGGNSSGALRPLAEGFRADSTVAELSRWWLDTIARHRVRVTTWSTYDKQLRLVCGHLGNIPVRRLRPGQVASMVSKVVDAGSAARARNVTSSPSVASATGWQRTYAARPSPRRSGEPRSRRRERRQARSRPSCAEGSRAAFH